jgi:hypothetical protein
MVMCGKIHTQTITQTKLTKFLTKSSVIYMQIEVIYAVPIVL